MPDWKTLAVAAAAGGLALTAGLWLARRSSSAAAGSGGILSWLEGSSSPDRTMSADYWNNYRAPGYTDKAAAAEVEAARKNAFGNSAGGFFAG
jgi:hypothetical protein